MNAGPTTERVYEALRERIASRAFRPGDRVEPAALAPGLASSVTPVRDALYILVGEGLVETRTGGGFFLPLLDEPGLEDLYEWSAQLLTLAVRGWPSDAGETPIAFVGVNDELSLAERTEQLFQVMARRSANLEHARAVARLNLRLHAVRSIEHVVLGNDDEFHAWHAAIDAGVKTELVSLVTRYHRRRRRAAAAILRCLYRGD